MNDFGAHVLLARTYQINAAPPVTLPSRGMSFLVNRTGWMKVEVAATGLFEDDTAPTGKSVGPLPVPWRLLDPDGKTILQSAANGQQGSVAIVTADLDKRRDLRGFVVDKWNLRLDEAVIGDEDTGLLRVGVVTVKVTLGEVIQSLSAPPLLTGVRVLQEEKRQTFPLDLYRLGVLRASVTGPFGRPLREELAEGITLTLLDPTGATFASGDSGLLSCQIPAAALAKSRGPQGAKRFWNLRVSSASRASIDGRLSAQVYDTARIPASVLQTRLDRIFGADGTILTVGAQWIEGTRNNRFTFTIHDQQAADTFGIYDLLDREPWKSLNPGADLSNPDVNTPYTYAVSEISGDDFFGWWVKMKNLRTTSFRFSFGESQARRRLIFKPSPGGGGGGVWVQEGDVIIPAGIPVVKFEAATSGSIYVDLNNWDDAELVIPKFLIEVGLTKSSDGKIALQAWVDPDSFRYGGDEGEAWLTNKPWVKTVMRLQEQLDQLSSSSFIQDIFDFLMGGRFHFTAARWANNGMEFDYIAAVEPERTPNIGYGPFGRLPAPGQQQSWTSPNSSKIDHIVVLMMENRSFDHVLGYLRLEGINANVNGLTDDILQQFNNPAVGPIRPLNQARFASNSAGLKTRFPLGVPHEYKNVALQMRTVAGVPMAGFKANFADRYKDGTDLQDNNCRAEDVLGYYTADQLPMYAFLAREFCVCDGFYSSHPGPTIPNRMFSLTGDLQRNRYAEPIVENDLGTLARDPTIFDLLTQRDVSWRQYESPPSVSMLRFFSRYAGDDINIRDIRFLAQDILDNNLPSVTFIDPQFHYSPPNDDHPPADMLRGQHLVRTVYQALRGNPSVWAKTLFVITYDEHGGLFDHVTPPVAELLTDPRRIKDAGEIGDGTPPTTQYKPNISVSYGVRVPTWLISPWAPRGSVVHTTLDFTSILKTILVRWCGGDRPFLSDRVWYANHLFEALSLSQVRTDAPRPPTLPSILPSGAGRLRRTSKRNTTGKDADFHDIARTVAKMVRG